MSSKDGAVDSPSLMMAARVNLGLAPPRVSRVVTQSGHSRSASHSGLIDPGGLNGEGFPHDGTALSKQLELGDSPATWGSLGSCRGRQGTEGSRSCLLEKRAHGLGLTKDGVHGQIWGQLKAYDYVVGELAT